MGLFSFGFNRHSPSEPGRGRIFSPLLRPCQTCGAETNSYRDGLASGSHENSPLKEKDFNRWSHLTRNATSGGERDERK